MYETIHRFRNAGGVNPEAVYTVLCKSSVAELASFLKETPARRIIKSQLLEAQAVLTILLTSKAGRPKTNTLSRQQQNAAAQSKRREKMNREGKKQINIWINQGAAEYLEAIKIIHRCDNQADALELVLEAVIKGQILKAKADPGGPATAD